MSIRPRRGQTTCPASTASVRALPSGLDGRSSFMALASCVEAGRSGDPEHEPEVTNPGDRRPAVGTARTVRARTGCLALVEDLAARDRGADTRTGSRPMTAIAAEGREMIRSFFGHEHEELIAGIDRLHEVAWDLPGLSAPETARRLWGVLHWVEETLQPHMAWEEQWLLPTIDDRAPTRWATSLVRFDHRQIARQ